MSDKKVLTIKEIEARNAQASYFGNGIQLAGGFDLGAKAALDSRATVKTILERDAHVTGNRAYEGMMVYVEETKKTYQLIDGSWEEFGFNADKFEAGIEDNLTSHSTITALSANQGRVLKEALDAQGEQLTTIEGKLDTAIEDIAGLGTELESGLTALDEKITAETEARQTADSALQSTIAEEVLRAKAAEKVLEDKLAIVQGTEEVEGSIAKALADAKVYTDTEVQGLNTTLTSAIDTAKTEAIDTAKQYADAEILKVTQSSNELAGRVDALDNELTGKVPALEGKVATAEGQIAALELGLSQEKTAREEADNALDAKIAANTSAIAQESGERLAGDQALQGLIDGLDARLGSVETDLSNISTDWADIESKPFETLGSTLEVTEGTKLDVKIDGSTIIKTELGALQVADGLFANEGHNHDEDYASKAHEENQEIHLTAEEKVNVGKIPTIESDVNLLKTTVGASSTHVIVQTLSELEGLIESCNHATIAHVIESNETYILEKDSDVNGNFITPEWIKLSDADALVSVDWSVINDKPFSTVGQGLVVEEDAVKVNTDETTITIEDGKIKVADGVFSTVDHTHTVTWEEIVNKPTVFTTQVSAEAWQLGTDLDEGLFSTVVEHNKNSEDVDVKVYGVNKLERLVAVEVIDENSVKIWTDTAEIVNVKVFSYSFTNPSMHSAVIAKAKRAK